MANRTFVKFRLAGNGHAECVWGEVIADENGAIVARLDSDPVNPNYKRNEVFRLQAGDVIETITEAAP